jgi:hypothetical protein
LKCNENLIFARANLARAYDVNEKNIIKNHAELDDFMRSPNELLHTLFQGLHDYLSDDDE